MKKICIYGAGAIGLDLGVRLLRIGHKLSFIARGENLTTLKNRGIEYKSYDGKFWFIRPDEYYCTDKIKSGMSPDYLFLTVKSDAMLQIGKNIPYITNKDTIIVSANNGIPPWYFSKNENLKLKDLNIKDISGDFLKYVNVEQLLGLVINRNVTLINYGIIKHNAGKGYKFGELNHNISLRCKELQTILNDADLESQISDNIHRDIWHKLLINLTVNPLSVISEKPIGVMFEDEEILYYVKKIIKEVHLLGEKLGVVQKEDFDIEEFINHFRTTRRESYTSMYYDYLRGCKLELNRTILLVIKIAKHKSIKMTLPYLNKTYLMLHNKICKNN